MPMAVNGCQVAVKWLSMAVNIHSSRLVVLVRIPRVALRASANVLQTSAVYTTRNSAGAARHDGRSRAAAFDPRRVGSASPPAPSGMLRASSSLLACSQPAATTFRVDSSRLLAGAALFSRKLWRASRSDAVARAERLGGAGAAIRYSSKTSAKSLRRSVRCTRRSECGRQ